MTLEHAALNFLAYEKRCELVLMERSPRERWHGQPDVLGITAARYLLEIEVKRSVSDFRANADKPHVRNRDLEAYLKKWPKQFWYLVEPKMVEKVRSEVPEWAGLMTVPDDSYSISVVKPAPTNAQSERLSLKELAKLGRAMRNQIMSLYSARFARLSTVSYGDSTAMDGCFTLWPPGNDYGNFQI